MLKKLLKYDLKWIYKVILVFYALAIFFALLSFGLSKAENSTLLNVLAQISCGFTVAMVANCIVNSIMRSWVRFRNNMYKDESYLTHTLPVSRNTVFLSKTLSAFICTFISTAVSAACIVLCLLQNASLLSISRFFRRTLLSIRIGWMLLCQKTHNGL